ncbi:MAG: hypothetical protein JXR77_04075, partial [Lentisphaeria bacterium]|nr:hypothetical protein [Lentisphaeria bacterium]
MRPSLVILPILLAQAQSGAAEAAAPAGRIDGFEAERSWSAIGRAESSRDPEGVRGACMRMRFGVEAEANYAIVQGPNDAASLAWERGVPPGANAFVFEAKASRPVALLLVLRVRERGVSGPQGVRGHFRAGVAVRDRAWGRYAVRFDDFRGDAGLPAVGDGLFRAFHPQLQFHVTPGPGTGPVDVWVDELAFAAAAASSVSELPPSRPGLDAASDVARMAREVASPPASVPSGARQSVDLRDGWVFVPWLEEQGAPGEPATTSLPQGWPPGRDYHAGWYLRRLAVGRPPPGPVLVRCGRVAFWCALFLDGRLVGEHAGGFTPFTFPIGPKLSPGEHLLALYVQDSTAAVQGDRAVMQVGVMRPDRSSPRG